ncbi:Clp protease [Eubacterium ruminantium]|uniref:ATP-dependent Clp protease proteolytic subunit n=1 Tax=Eubacterium ruminantium TaxID=42322 RepID=A0A1T4P123_9FIRM|nr:ATP-dependent Clp protease proteolytic subunit [Eubacterium ruminantium]SCW56850.1 Clp protease [Eubacterium ruminantium]SDN07280.1 Clp protease [Eubacterium ruminantium]SJZ85092.1 Clp protease [Eubacterium ruminantium]
MAEEKFMDGKEIADITINDIITEYFNNTGEIRDLDCILEKVDFLDRTLHLGDIEEATGDVFSHLIRFWNMVDKNIPVKKRQPIKIIVNSSGGDLVSALTISDAITLSKTPVYTINTGKAYSGGLIVFICGHKRFCYPSASFLFHEGSTTTGEMDAGKFKNFATYYNSLILKMKNYLIKNTNVTEEIYKEKSRDDWWVFSEEGIELGFVDKILKEFI